MLEEVNSFGLFNSPKCITFGDVAGLNALEQKKLLEYISNPNLSTTLILLTEKLDGRSPLATYKNWKTGRVNYEIESNQDIQEFIHYKLKQLGSLKMDASLMHCLLQSYQSDLGHLGNTLEIIAACADYKSPLLLEHYFPSKNRNQPIKPFGFTDAILHKNFTEAMKHKNALSNQNESIFKTLGSLRHQFEKWLYVKELMRQKVDPTEIASVCKLHPFAVKKLIEPLSRRSHQELNQSYQTLADCDYTLKSSTTSPDHLFEMLIFKLCQ